MIKETKFIHPPINSKLSRKQQTNLEQEKGKSLW